MTRNSCLPLLVGLTLLWSAKAAQAQVQGGGTPGHVPVWTDPSTLGDSVITQDVNNKIGIGTVAPSATFTVAGAGGFDILGSARFDLFNTRLGNGFLQHVTDQGTWQIASMNTGSTRMVIDPNGNVGIGTLTPDIFKLFVDGAGGGFGGVYGTGHTEGVRGQSSNTGVRGDGDAFGVFGSGVKGIGVYGTGSSYGVRGQSSNIGVRGDGDAFGVLGSSLNGTGVYGFSESGWAGYFDGKVTISVLGTAGGTSLCRNLSSEIAACSSSLRYKTDVRPFVGGLDIVNRLRPIAFTWKEGGADDVGLAAEDVEQVEPLLTFRNDKGEVEGVKYNQLSAVFVNAIRDQQAQIEHQKEEIERQQEQITEQRSELAALKTLVCASHTEAAVCQ